MKVKAIVASCVALLLVAGGGYWRVQSQSEVKATIRVNAVMRQPTTRSVAQTIEYMNPDAERQFTSLKPSFGWRERAARYEPYIHIAARKYAVDARLLWTIAFLETGFRPEMISPKGARRMMQFMPETARRYGLINPHDPADSIDAAARYVRDLALRFGNRFDLILASYNAGEAAVDAYLKGYALRLTNNRVINPRGIKLGGIPPYAETRSYVARGLEIVRLLPNATLDAQTSEYIRSKLRITGYNASTFALSQPQQIKSVPKSLYISTPNSNSKPVDLPPTNIREIKTHSFRIVASTTNSN